jgi:hopanoid biosynthesis associated radical SAM protein HpnH
MAIPFFKEIRIGGYLIKQKLLGRKRYPLVLMLEPLFRCNLACVGCGKIDYPDAILNRRMTAQECWDAADECGAPMVAIPGGEPLIHKDIGEIVRGLVARKKFVSLCTNAMLLEKKLDLFEPSPYLFFSVHLDGLKDHHDKAVSQKGVFDRAVSAIKAARARGFTVNVNATIFDGHPAEEIAKFLDFTTELGVGVSMSPGYAYERAPDQDHFLNRTKTKKLFRDVFALGKGKKWNFMHSGLFLDFLAGNQEYECTPWGMPARNIFGWQKPCYLLGEGYAKTFKELMETTDWDSYGTGKYEKCANCMAHCGYEPTAATAALNNPLKAMWVALRGVKTTGPMAPEINLSTQRPAQYIFSEQVQKKLSEIRRAAESCLHGRIAPVQRLHGKKARSPGDRAFFSLKSSDLRGNEAAAAEQETTAAAQALQRTIEVDAGGDQGAQRPGILHHAAEDLAQVDVAVRLDRGPRQRRQRPAGRVADDPQGGKGKTGFGCVGGRDMAFHVDGGGTGLGAQCRLAGLRHHHLFDTRKAAPDDTAATHGKRCDLVFGQGKTGKPARIAGRDLGRDHDVAGFQGRVEPARDPEGDYAADGRWVEYGE